MQYVPVIPSRISLVISLVAAATTIISSSFLTPALASDLTIEDQMSLQDPLQSRVTICHVPNGDFTQAHDITVGESVVPNHLAHGDRIGQCLLTQQPTITVESPTSCTSTENGLVSYARVILSGFPIGLVVIMGPESSGFPLLIEMQAETQSVPVGFPLGEKTLTAFADVNRNLLQDAGEASAATTFTVTCW
jgi:hypothetical protein